MLTLRIMHQCVMKLLNFEGEPDEAAVENLTTLLRAVGGTMEEESETGAGFIAAYFERIESAILKSEALASRPKFMVMDLMDLRKAGWKGKNDNKGPKTIQQIHQEAEAAAAKAEAERQRTAQRGGPAGGRPPAGRGDVRNFSGGAPPIDHQRNTVGLDDLRRLQARGQANRATGSGLGPGGSLGPGSMLGARSGSRRGAGNLGPSSSGNTTRTNTPPVGDKKDEAPSQNAFK
jgi:translation initiation factor 4G